MKRFINILKHFSLIAIVTLLSFLLLEQVGSGFVKEENESPLDTQTTTSIPTQFHLVAIGDSLTQGVGDRTQRGGYIPLTAQNLRRHDVVKIVETENFGKSGNTTTQITERILTEGDIQTALKEATVISVTAGGNDLIRFIRQSRFQPNWEKAEESRLEYETNLIQLIQTIREYQKDAPIFLFGIYNPYEKQLEEIDYLQLLVSNWNQTMEKIAEEEEAVIYLPVHQLFRSSNTTVSGDQAEEEHIEEEHPYLFEEDYFHPNERGYGLMADLLTEQIIITFENKKGESRGD